MANCRDGGHIFAAVSAVESAYAIRDDLDASHPDNLISVRYFMDCDYTNMGCNGGGQPYKIWRFMAKEGFCTWSDFPRNEPAETPKSMNVYNCPKYLVKNLVKVARDLKSIVMKNPSIDILKALLQYQPVVAGININDFSPLYQYKSGIIADTAFACSSDYNDDARKINSYVTIVGYKEGSTVNGCSGHWIVKNNWGPTWGEQGYFRICIPSDITQYPYGHCNLHQVIQIPDVGLIPGYLIPTTA